MYTRDVPQDRINNHLQDFLPESARNALHARSKSVLKKRLFITDQQPSYNYNIKKVKPKEYSTIISNSRKQFKDIINQNENFDISLDDNRSHLISNI